MDSKVGGNRGEVVVSGSEEILGFEQFFFLGGKGGEVGWLVGLRVAGRRQGGRNLIIGLHGMRRG